MDRITEAVKDLKCSGLYEAAARDKESELLSQELAPYFPEDNASGDSGSDERQRVLQLVGKIDRLVERLGLALLGDLYLESRNRLVPYERDREEVRDAYSSAYKLDRIDIVLGKENDASSEEREPQKERYQSEDVIERQECKILDLEPDIVLDRGVHPDKVCRELDLLADGPSAVRYDLRL